MSLSCVADDSDELKGLHYEPDLVHLTREVGTEVCAKWKLVANELGLEHSITDVIASIPNDPLHHIREVFIHWSKQPSDSHPYTWATMIGVLRSKHQRTRTGQNLDPEVQLGRVQLGCPN